MTDENETVNNDRTSPTTTGHPIPEFYSNAVTVYYSPYEFEISHLMMDSRNQIKGALNVRMSPQMAKSMLKILERQVADYENTVGNIVIPSYS